MAAAQGQDVVSQRRWRGSASSQTAVPAPRKKTENFDNSPRPAAKPAASHQRGSALSRTLHNVQNSSALVTMDGMSGVAASISTDTIRVRLKMSAARAAFVV